MPTARKKTAPVEPPSGDGWISLNQAARLLDITYSTVATRILRGEFRTVTFAGRAYVSREDVERAVKSEA